MQSFWSRASSCSAALTFVGCLLVGCSVATQAAFVPQLDLGLRSSRSQDAHQAAPSTRDSQRWDLTVFARLAWTSRRSAALIPSRNDLSPDAWIDPCPDQDCFWDSPDDDSSTVSEDAP